MPSTSRRASSPGATRSERRRGRLTPCSGSPSSPERRRASARRPPEPSPRVAGTASSSRDARSCSARSRTRSAARSKLCDVADRAAVEALAGRVLERHPSIHLLVNNAGMPARGTFLKADLDLIERVIRVNYLGSVWCTRALHARARGGRRAVGGARTSSTWSPWRAPSPSRRPAATRPRSTPSSRSRARWRRPCAAPASPSTRSCRASSRPRASRRRTSSRAASCSGS